MNSIYLDVHKTLLSYSPVCYQITIKEFVGLEGKSRTVYIWMFTKPSSPFQKFATKLQSKSLLYKRGNNEQH